MTDVTSIQSPIYNSTNVNIEENSVTINQQNTHITENTTTINQYPETKNHHTTVIKEHKCKNKNTYKKPPKKPNTRSYAEQLAFKIKCQKEGRKNCDRLTQKALVIEGRKLPDNALRGVNDVQKILVAQDLYLRDDNAVVSLDECQEEVGRVQNGKIIFHKDEKYKETENELPPVIIDPKSGTLIKGR